MAVSIKFERNQIKNGRLANGVYTARLIQVIDPENGICSRKGAKVAKKINAL